MSYQGWANYATWNVHLWLTNEEEVYISIRHMAAHAADKYDLARQIETLLTEGQPELPPSLYSDILTHALAEVNWVEVAQAFMEET